MVSMYTASVLIGILKKLIRRNEGLPKVSRLIDKCSNSAFVGA